jgi:hypothetical protein
MTEEERRQSVLSFSERQLAAAAAGRPNSRAAAAVNSKNASKNSRGQGQGRGTDESDEPELQFLDDNVLFVMFDRPVTVSVVRFFNYSKTPMRGVREIGIDVDGSVVFMGTLRSADSKGYDPMSGQSIVFTSDPKITRMEKNKVC